MTPSAAELLSAITHAQRQFVAWHQANRLTDAQLEQIARYYDLWRDGITPEQDYSPSLPSDDEVPIGVAAEHVAQARRLIFLRHDLLRHIAAQRISPEPARVCEQEVENALGQLAGEIDQATAGRSNDATDCGDASDAMSQRGLTERLLDPRSLQALMACGGGLLVLGLVIWLWSVGVFENSLVVAGLMGVASVSALAGGVALALRTRYQSAGRAVTMLACLVLPLNLWFYDAQGLITLDEGGHLWAPALAICCLYAGVARLLKDSRFVYAFVAGATMTGLLLLADQRVERFWEVIAPSTLLVAIGVACVHAERLFLPTKSGYDGPYSRETFGAAFFQSGHMVLAAGLAVLLGGRLVGWFFEPLSARFQTLTVPDVVAVANVKLMALGLALAGAYTYFYSLLVAGRGSRYAYSGLLLLMWCGVIGFDLLGIAVTEQLITLMLAGTALLASGAGAVLARTGNPTDERVAKEKLFDSVTLVGGGLASVSLLMGLVQFARAAFAVPFTPSFAFAWPYGVAMGMTAAATLVAARSFASAGRPRRASLSVQAAGVAATLAAFGALNVCVAWLGSEALLPVAALAPLVLLVVAHFTKSAWRQSALRQGAQLGGVLLLSVAAGAAVGVAVPAGVGASPLLLGLFFAESASLFGLSTYPLRGEGARSLTAPVLAACCCWAAAWQWLPLLGFAEHASVMAASVVGLVCLAASRSRGERGNGLASTGTMMTVLGGAAGMLLTGNRLLGGEVAWSLLGLIGGQTGVALAAAILSRTRGARHTLFCVAAGHIASSFVVLNALSGLSLGQRIEIMLTVVGALLLAFGHLGWRKEALQADGRSTTDGLVSFNLAAGSLLAAGPLLWGLLNLRLGGAAPHGAWELLHEVGVLSVGIGLLAAGVLCRIRSTTLAGAVSLVGYAASLVLLIHLPDRLQTVSVYMMVGGATFFGGAVLLSVYRDRLLQLPEKVRMGEGVFRVLHWR